MRCCRGFCAASLPRDLFPVSVRARRRRRGGGGREKDAIESYCSMVAAAGVGVQMVGIFTHQPSPALIMPLITRKSRVHNMSVQRRGFMSYDGIYLLVFHSHKTYQT